MVVLLGIYYVTPWLRWDRGAGRPDQAVLVDFDGRRFFFGPLELWPQEIYYVTGLMVLSALALFLFTALFGRIWCGYACPQTVWTDLYLFVERRIEGDRTAQMRLAASRWTPSKIGKKLAKHVLWLVIAMVTGGAWIFYFTDAPTLFHDLFTGHASATSYFFVGLLTFTTYSLAGTMREQVCTYMCPWPRIQAAMIDVDSLSVTYRAGRGEPRGAHKKGVSWEGRGDCIDCNQCVAVCPMGIDIRDGFQLECINCGLCADACNTIMERVDRPRGLISYVAADTGERVRPRFIRPRTILYASLLVALAALMTFGLLTRPTFGVDLIRDRNPAFVRLSDGSVRNGYTVRILNMRTARNVIITVETTAPIAMHGIGATVTGSQARLDAAADTVTSAHLFVSIAPSKSGAPHNLRFVIRDAATGETVRKTSAFLSDAS
jgi:cytochrome c oxidase accessory protein FixG